MAFTYNKNSGLIFSTINYHSKYPNYKGTINVEGKEFSIAGWLKKTIHDKEFISLQIVPNKPSDEKVPINKKELSERKKKWKAVNMLHFYDVKTKEYFDSNNYRIQYIKDKNNNQKIFAVSPSPKGKHKCWRVISKEFAEKIKTSQNKTIFETRYSTRNIEKKENLKNPYPLLNKEIKKTKEYGSFINQPPNDHKASKNFFSQYYGEKEAHKKKESGHYMEVDAPGIGSREGHKYMRSRTYVETKYRDRVTEKIEKRPKDKF